MNSDSYTYDLAVIGSGPAGQRAAIQAAKIGKRVAVFERRQVVGGVCVNTGTIPSKTLREAILYLTGYSKHEIYGDAFVIKQRITMADLRQYLDFVVRHEIDVIRRHLQMNAVDVVYGEASFTGPHTLSVNGREAPREISAKNFVVAVGTEPRIDHHIPFDGQHVLTSDDIVNLGALPRNLAVVGGGVIGCEYANMFATLGVPVTLIDKRSRLLPFVDGEIVGALQYHLNSTNTTVWLNEEVRGIELVNGGETGGEKVSIQLASGKKVAAEKALYLIGRVPATAGLNLPAAGVECEAGGTIKVDANYRTCVPHIFAAGDVIGFPSLASTSTEQGRIAACRCFGIESPAVPQHFPYGIYTIPEISYVGQNEEELTKNAVPYQIGKASYRETSRGLIIGDTHGMLKLLFDSTSRKLLGVHIIGTNASDLVHIGQAVMNLGATIDYFVENIFNYPTLAECYKVAALNGINRLNA